MTEQDYTQHPITPPPPHLLKKFSAQAQDEAKKRNGAGYLKTFATLCIEWAMTCQSTSNDRQIRSSEIEPPPELVVEWQKQAPPSALGVERITHIATQAARWGAEQELEACLDEIYKGVGLRIIDHGSHRELLCSDLRAARRPKPPSLKKQALDAWDRLRNEAWCEEIDFDLDCVRRALEALDD